MKTLALIPARGGSKSIPGKNLSELAGRPLIAWTIEAALKAITCDRTVVSTDSQDVSNAAREAGAEVPFVRPTEISGDEVPALEVIRHAVDELGKHDGWCADLVVYLQPTSPFRRAEHIDGAVRQFLEKRPDVLVSVVRVPHAFSPDSLLVRENDEIRNYIPQKAQMLRRQNKPLYWARNGPALLVATTEHFKTKDSIYSGRTCGYEMSALDSIDIDEAGDLFLARALAAYIQTQEKSC